VELDLVIGALQTFAVLFLFAGIPCDSKGRRTADPLPHDKPTRKYTAARRIKEAQVRPRTIATLSCTRTSKRATLTTMRSCVPSPIGSFSSRNRDAERHGASFDFRDFDLRVHAHADRRRAKWRISRRVPSD